MNFLICNAIFLLERVSVGSFQHFLPVILAILFAVFFIKYAKSKLKENQQNRVIHRFACFVSLTVIVFHIHKLSFGHYNIATDLPLYLCSLLGIIIPVFTYYRKLWMYEVLLFWIIVGTLQGVITPDIPEGFPSFDYFRYWIVHLGLLIIISYAIFVLKMRPKLKSVFKSFLALQFYLLMTVTINYVLNSNYFYLNQKPKSASILDCFGAWPYYIIVSQILVIPSFLLIYFLFALVRKGKMS
ncbi:MAG: TIGR02206 family membrane protein [Algibacter sp.]